MIPRAFCKGGLPQRVTLSCALAAARNSTGGLVQYFSNQSCHGHGITMLDTLYAPDGVTQIPTPANVVIPKNRPIGRRART